MRWRISAGLAGSQPPSALSTRASGSGYSSRPPRVTAVGAGLQLSPNASRVLHHLGLGPALAGSAVLPGSAGERHWQDGGCSARYEINGTPAALRRAALPGLPAGRWRLLGVPDGVLQLLAAGRGGPAGQRPAPRSSSRTAGEATGDSSSERTASTRWSGPQLFGADAPTFSGTVAYRGLLPAAKVAGYGYQHLDEVVGASTRAPPGALPHRGCPRRAVSLVNVVGVVPEDWRTESWTARGRVSDFVAAFDCFHPPIPELVGAVEEVYKFAIYDRPPLAEWTVGRVSLLGGREPSDGAVHGSGGRDGHRGRRDTGQVREPLRGRRTARAFAVRPGQAGADGPHATGLARRHVRHLGQQGVGVWVRPLRCLTPVIAARPPGPGCRGPIAARRRRPSRRPDR